MQRRHAQQQKAEPANYSLIGLQVLKGRDREEKEGERERARERAREREERGKNRNTILLTEDSGDGGDDSDDRW